MDINTIRHISRTNSLLRPEDISPIRQVAEHCQQDLIALQNEIEATRALLALLESKLEKTKTDIALCAAISSPCPVRRLPSELLCLVFAFACAGDKLDFFFSKKNQIPVALSLVRVCKYWRDVVLDSRCLSKHTLIVDKERRLRSLILVEGEEEKYQRHMDSIIGLHGSSLSRVHLHHDGTLTLNGITNKIFKQQRHLASFHFFGEYDSIFRNREGLREFNMPLLEELLIPAFLPWETEVQGAIPFEVPRLHRLFLLDPDMTGFFVDRLVLPWQQITHLSFGHPYNQGSFPRPYRVHVWHFLRLLEQLPALTYLHLTNILLADEEEGANGGTSLTRVSLQSLKSLEIQDNSLALLCGHRVGDWDESEPLSFLPYIECPVLETFDLLFSAPSIDQLHPIGPFLRGTPSLRRIRLALFSTSEFLGLDGFPTRYIVHLSGNRAFFAHLDATTSRSKKDYGFINLGEKMQAPRGGWLNDDLWMDHLIDRRFWLEEASSAAAGFSEEEDFDESHDDQGDDSETESDEYSYVDDHSDAEHGENGDGSGLRKYLGKVSAYYNPGDLATIKGIFKLLADPKLDSNAESHVYLAV